jgi:hypothetical protein
MLDDLCDECHHGNDPATLRKEAAARGAKLAEERKKKDELRKKRPDR